jgi:solute carrier family 6 GABA transporter-like protein 1
MREIPSLRILALRAVGPPGCNPEVTFGGPRAAGRGGGADGSTRDRDDDDGGDGDDADDADEDADADATARRESRKKRRRGASERRGTPLPPLDPPTPTSRLLGRLRDGSAHLRVGPYVGLAGRPNAADVDISHPWIMAAHPPRRGGGNVNNGAPLVAIDERGEANGGGGGGGGDGGGGGEFLTIENGNHAVECLQQFIDALVESGRAGDTRMGVRFFREWAAAVVGRDVAAGWDAAATVSSGGGGGGVGGGRSSKKRQKSTAAAAVGIDDSAPLGSLSLHNFSNGAIRTFRSMERANVGRCLGTLDVTGVHGLTDAILSNVICGGSFPRLRRLSVKNCRKLTGKGIASLVRLPNLSALDVGGCFNVHPDDVVSMVRGHPSTKRGEFEEVYASGLGWTDVALDAIVDATAGQLRGLGVGFSPYISGPGLILTLSRLSSTLDHLAVPFCPGMDDAAASALGKQLPRLAVLDIRGCNKVYSLSGMMEGRAGAASAKHLFVLARYSGISINSLEETLRLYESETLTCILDGGGTGGGIRR